MSTKAIREALDTLEAYADTDEDWAQHKAAMEAVKAIERAAKALVKHHVGDVMVDRVAHSEEVIGAMTTSESQWHHPSVSAVSDACAVLTSIAKDAP